MARRDGSSRRIGSRLTKKRSEEVSASYDSSMSACWHAKIYEWSSGGHVYLLVEERSVRLHVQTSQESCFFLIRHGRVDAELLQSSVHQLREVETSNGAKVVAFLLDIGSPADIDGSMVNSLIGGGFRYPEWVSSEAWAHRYDLARDKTVSAGGGISGFNSRFFSAAMSRIPGISRRLRFCLNWADNGLWSVNWVNSFYDRVLGREDPLPYEEAVDLALSKSLVFPREKKEAYDKEHLEYGSFVLPSSEEVEIYRAIGERLPFFWEPEDLCRWLEEKGISPHEPPF